MLYEVSNIEGLITDVSIIEFGSQGVKKLSAMALQPCDKDWHKTASLCHGRLVPAIAWSEANLMITLIMGLRKDLGWRLLNTVQITLDVVTCYSTSETFSVWIKKGWHRQMKGPCREVPFRRIA
jgi:hypothetical protein